MTSRAAGHQPIDRYVVGQRVTDARAGHAADYSFFGMRVDYSRVGLIHAPRGWFLLPTQYRRGRPPLKRMQACIAAADAGVQRDYCTQRARASTIRMARAYWHEHASQPCAPGVLVSKLVCPGYS